ncbi:CRISPR system Cascade subunit CasC [Streptomyces sp. RB5]|uniref:CRISPR system Cascade subunit CasC n=1 Tax=Streptomyces smaragdinus TaxID=2585196 RepID=A0A7K0CQ61_9ACTN|nr:type I-E CRISPR-associated protein Cas7/Cse4/CasC [Streptomyces smaragdinus]MQY15162.1 CRISPR system Cascade subunit CasC [Streptomyces smaragdinus]
MTHPARFIDVHILQSVPFANLNRDDTNSVKTVLYGNSLRTRVSSQCWKRASRLEFERATGESALRTRRIAAPVAVELEEQRGWPKELAERAGAHIAACVGKFEVETTGEPKKPIPNRVITNAMVYVPQVAIKELADIAEEHRETLEQAKNITKNGDVKASALPKDKIDTVLRSRNSVINLFGRMLAEVDRAGVDGAVQVAHAMTTHEADPDLDYFTAVDDITSTWQDSTGSAHMGHTEFSAGTYYRYATVDLDELVTNLTGFDTDIRTLLNAFLTAFTLAVPQAKKNSTAPHTLPHLVHLAVRADRPVSYAAAFEEPVRGGARGGNAGPSVQALTDYAAATALFLGTGHVVTRAWASPELKDLSEALGSRADGLDALLGQVIDQALDSRRQDA